MNIPIVGLLGMLLAAAAAQDAPVPVEQEPLHKTVLKNDYVQAFRVTLGPGKATLMHIHAHADGAVRLSSAIVASGSLGEPIGPPEMVAPGQVSARENEPKPLIHRVDNVGTTIFDVIDVQVLRRPDGPTSEPLGQPAAENARMRVYQYDLAPGASSEQHTHKRPYLLVAVTDVSLRMTSPDGRAMEHPVKAGDMRWVDTEVTHALCNQGTEKAILVEFELK
jgi:quercetin dioxygenase-like cupin family protein